MPQVSACRRVRPIVGRAPSPSMLRSNSEAQHAGVAVDLQVLVVALARHSAQADARRGAGRLGGRGE